MAAYLLYAAAGLAISLVPSGSRSSGEASFAKPSCRQGDDRIMLFDDPLTSGLARLAMIQEATHSLHIAYFAIEPDASSDAFIGALLDAPTAESPWTLCWMESFTVFVHPDVRSLMSSHITPAFGSDITSRSIPCYHGWQTIECTIKL